MVLSHPGNNDLNFDGPATVMEVPEVLEGDLIGDPSQTLDDMLAAEAIENEDEIEDQPIDEDAAR
jgi:hypothetical protein